MPLLHEYQSIELPLTRHQAEALQATGFVTVQPASGGGWTVTASSFVGTLVVGGVELLIRPKVRPENLFLLLEPGLPESAWRREAYDYDISSNLLTSVIGFFARTVEATLARGVLRSYARRDEELVAMRGRLDLSGQFRRSGVLSPIACTYDDFTEDVPENHVLRAAIRRALMVSGIDVGVRQRLMRQLIALEGVADVAVDASSIDRIHFNRLNEHYGPALGLARIVLMNVTLADARGGTAASSFMVDMNDLFQRFVTDRLRRELRGRLDLVSEPVVHLGEQRRVSMQPDLVFKDRARREVYVGDVKYKVTFDGSGRSSDYYQLLAYTTAMQLPGGALIYCGRDVSTTREVTVRHTGQRLQVHAIDLSDTAEMVAAQIRRIADTIARLGD